MEYGNTTVLLTSSVKVEDTRHSNLGSSYETILDIFDLVFDGHPADIITVLVANIQMSAIGH